LVQLFKRALMHTTVRLPLPPVEDAVRVVERREENQRERNRVEEERSHVGDVDENKIDLKIIL